jgi:hypothetical protein
LEYESWGLCLFPFAGEEEAKLLFIGIKEMSFIRVGELLFIGVVEPPLHGKEIVEKLLRMGFLEIMCRKVMKNNSQRSGRKNSVGWCRY